jgi:hypothetical protein
MLQKTNRLCYQTPHICSPTHIESMLDLFDSSVVVTLLPEQNDGFVECGLSVVTGDSCHGVQLLGVAVQSGPTALDVLHKSLKDVQRKQLYIE